MCQPPDCRQCLGVVGREPKVAKVLWISGYVETRGCEYLRGALSSSLYLWDRSRCAYRVARERSAWRGVLRVKYLFCSSYVHEVCAAFSPPIVYGKQSGYSAQFAAHPASVESRISFPSLPLTLAILRSEEGAACHHLLGYRGSDGLGSTPVCGRPRESWGLFFAAVCQPARPNCFRHK